MDISHFYIYLFIFFSTVHTLIVESFAREIFHSFGQILANSYLAKQENLFNHENLFNEIFDFFPTDIFF